MSQLLNWLKKLITPSSYHSELEQYIVSKGPQTPADVDHWTRQFQHNLQQQWSLK